MRYSAYEFNDDDRLISNTYLTDLILPKNVRPFQKIDRSTRSAPSQYQMSAYFMQYLSFAMKTDLNIFGIEIPHPSWVGLIVHGARFKFSNLAKRYIQCRNIIVDKNNDIKAPHYLESYYFLTKRIGIVNFN